MGIWGCRFFSFGYFLVQFFRFCTDKLQPFSFGIHHNLQFLNFLVFGKNTDRFLQLLYDVIFGFSNLVSSFFVHVSTLRGLGNIESITFIITQ